MKKKEYEVECRIFSSFIINAKDEKDAYKIASETIKNNPSVITDNIDISEVEIICVDTI